MAQNQKSANQEYTTDFIKPMDRTKEFRTIVLATSIPQNECKPLEFYKDLHTLQENIRCVVKEVSHLTSYETFRIQQLLTKGYGLVKDLRKIDIPNTRPGVSEDVLSSLKSITTGFAMRATLRLNEASRKCASRVSLRENGNPPAHSHKSSAEQQHTQAIEQMSPGQVALQESTQSTEQNEEVIHERRRIVKSITEIGQMVEDISIHVSLQEEQLRRIDDSMMRSEKWSKRALNELKETWEIAGENRGQMCKFFGTWLVIFIIFWLVKR